MAAASELLIVAVSSAVVLALAWLVTRRVVMGGSLDSFTVSRQWLLRHQADDHS
jgi:hypothetical protein